MAEGGGGDVRRQRGHRDVRHAVSVRGVEKWGMWGEVRNRRAVDRGGDAVVAVLENGTREGDSGARGATQHSELCTVVLDHHG